MPSLQLGVGPRNVSRATVQARKPNREYFFFAPKKDCETGIEPMTSQGSQGYPDRLAQRGDVCMYVCMYVFAWLIQELPRYRGRALAQSRLREGQRD